MPVVVSIALRRRADPEPFVLGDLAIHYDERRVSVAGRAVELTASEYELLRLLSLNAAKVVAYEALLRKVFGKQDGRDARNALRTLVGSLPRKLGDSASEPAYVRNVRRVATACPGPIGGERRQPGARAPSRGQLLRIVPWSPGRAPRPPAASGGGLSSGLRLHDRLPAAGGLTAAASGGYDAAAAGRNRLPRRR